MIRSDWSNVGICIVLRLNLNTRTELNSSCDSVLTTVDMRELERRLDCKQLNRLGEATLGESPIRAFKLKYIDL